MIGARTRPISTEIEFRYSSWKEDSRKGGEREREREYRYVNNASKGRSPLFLYRVRKPPLPPPRLFSSFPFSIFDPPPPPPFIYPIRPCVSYETTPSFARADRETSIGLIYEAIIYRPRRGSIESRYSLSFPLLLLLLRADRN